MHAGTSQTAIWPRSRGRMANRAHFVVVPAGRNDPEAAVLREVHEEVARHLNGVQNLFEQWSAGGQALCL